MRDDEFVAWFAGEVASLPSVLAVTLGGSRATATHRPDSDWDFALYYRGRFDADAVRARGWPGTVTDPGGWGGGIMNGGAWLRIDGRKVDLHYRDLDDVEHWLAEAEAGRFERQLLLFHLAGIPTYVVVGELALNRVLHGELPSPDFPEALREPAARRWHDAAVLTLGYAEAGLTAGDVALAAGNLARALIEESHSRLAARGEWALNEKRIVARAGLDAVAALLTESLPDALAAARAAIVS